MNETSVSMKIAAASQGAEVDFNDDWYDDDYEKKENVLSGFEIKHMPIGLGYEVISE
jgi:hypothetical protein